MSSKHTESALIADLNARITALEAENERLKEAARWIPVSERLPVITPDLAYSLAALVYCPRTKNTHTATFGSDGEWYHFGGDMTLTAIPSHWMPLPEPPQQEPDHE